MLDLQFKVDRFRGTLVRLLYPSFVRLLVAGILLSTTLRWHSSWLCFGSSPRWRDQNRHYHSQRLYD
jgi:hypothetical protein